MKKLVLAAAIAAFGVLTVGCATNEGETSSPGVDALREAPLDVAASDDDYLVFASHAEALTWFDGMKPALVSMIGPAAVAVAEGDPRTQRIKGLVGRHWSTIRSRFGVTLPLPEPIVVESPVPNAFVMFDPRSAKIVNAIMVLTPSLTMSDDELDAILVHELAHLVQKHVVPGAVQELERYYLATEAEGLGIEATDDPAVRETVSTFLKAAGEAGAFDAPELEDVPATFGNLGLHLLLSARAKLATDPANKPCNGVFAHFNGLSRAIAAALQFDKRFAPNDAQRAQIAASVAGIRASAPTCLAPSPTVEFPNAAASLLAPAFGGDVQVALGRLEAFFGDDARVFAGKDALEGLYAGTRLYRGRVETTMRAPTYSKLRRYTTEEEADDLAMTVLHLDGRDGRLMGKAVLRLVPDAMRSQCESFIATGAVPHYDLPALHHSECYRRYHADHFTAWLERGGQGVAPAGSGPRVIKNRRAFDPNLDRILTD